MGESFSLDLPKHAADKVKRALDDVLALTDDPGEKLRIALMASSIPIGAAAGTLSGRARAQGVTITEKDATVQILELLKVATMDGPSALFTSVKAGERRE